MKKILSVLLTVFITFSSFAINEPVSLDKEAKIYIHNTSAGVAAFAFSDNGKVKYIIDLSDGSFYEYEGTYTKNEKTVEVNLTKGHGETNMGIELKNIKPKRSKVHLNIKDNNTLVDQDHLKHGVFHLLENPKGK
ncbi:MULTISPECIES: hypothetical protein [Flammeovirga]|uniref:Uncharacterized protein n=1 Tax=Flammeovirga agarivorans TaxID=2726742 RepID=A0A7X8XVE8_9BACT|nr:MULTISPECIES: hypothetical protein [Flammeovirga]NLR90995.1 hypothetical protein [Flammeovirga agarivorans]